MPGRKKNSSPAKKGSRLIQSKARQQQQQEQVDSLQVFSIQVASGPLWRSSNPEDDNQDRKLSPLRKELPERKNIVTKSNKCPKASQKFREQRQRFYWSGYF